MQRSIELNHQRAAPDRLAQLEMFYIVARFELISATLIHALGKFETLPDEFRWVAAGLEFMVGGMGAMAVHNPEVFKKKSTKHMQPV